MFLAALRTAQSKKEQAFENVLCAANLGDAV